MTIVLLSLFIWFALGFISAEIVGREEIDKPTYTYSEYVLCVLSGIVSFIIVLVIYIGDKPIERFRK